MLFLQTLLLIAFSALLFGLVRFSRSNNKFSKSFDLGFLKVCFFTRDCFLICIFEVASNPILSVLFPR